MTCTHSASIGCFAVQFTGSGNTDFYGRFCNDKVHNKPMVITETSAMYNPSNANGQTDYQIKSNWWQQVFNVQGANSIVRLVLTLASPLLQDVQISPGEKISLKSSVTLHRSESKMTHRDLGVPTRSNTLDPREWSGLSYIGAELFGICTILS